MFDTYQLNLTGLLGLCAALFLAQQNRTKTRAGKPDAPAQSRSGGGGRGGDASQTAFLVVYGLVMGADWLQGPFLYSLYADEHGLAPGVVSALFTTGFLAGAASGSVAGSVADRRGRKAACLFFCVACAASCLLTTVPSLPVLLAGRVLGGVSTSLLFSVFEGWMVTDFHARGLGARGGDLGRTFARMSTVNSVVAILSGVGSEWLVSKAGTRKAPFAASAVLLGVAFCVIWSYWAENYGETGPAQSNKEGATTSKPAESKLRRILTDRKIVSLGLASTVFEGSMYLFVFFWAPALRAAQTSTPQAAAAPLPYGLIFASFMAAMMASSLVFGGLAGAGGLRYTTLLLGILGTAAGCFLVLPAAAGSEQATFWLFCLFEAAVGMYWPCVGYLKGRLIEDGVRAQVYSMLRVPLNVFVVCSLVVTGDGGAYKTVFSACAALLLASTGALWATILTKDAP